MKYCNLKNKSYLYCVKLNRIKPICVSIYNFNVKAVDGGDISMSQFRGKVLLIVNTATKCGFTPQYEGLQILYDKYKEQGFEILDFPCNQFGHQAPGSNEEIGNFCVLRYKTTFTRFAKIDVNGVLEEPLYRFLKSRQGGFINDEIKWNFTKFLVSRDGEVIDRYSPVVQSHLIDR